jgi:DNA-binding GntR family transcriptional regulator
MSLEGAERLEARSLAAAVQQRLENDILSGRLFPGERLRLHSLVESYAVGMSPLREALARLAGQGLVVQESQRGFAVAPISSRDLADLTITRVRLETMALKLAIENGTAEWEASVLSAHHRLSRHQRGAEKLIDDDWENLHRLFHMALISACGSPLLLSFCQALNNHFDRYRRVAIRFAKRQPTIAGIHAQLVEAAIGRKATKAMDLLSGHIQESQKQILRMGGSRMLQSDRGSIAHPKSSKKKGKRSKGFS